jgi:metal-sulfur cluster biosynthetic enzyme
MLRHDRRMASASIPIQLQSDTDTPAASGGCGLCSTPLGAAACSPGVARRRCPAPRLVGPPDQLARVLQALRRVADPECGGNVVDGGLIQALELRQGEAELTLVAGTSGCAIGNLIAEEAFLALRTALPDTDVYVSHDRVNPWRNVFSAGQSA